MPIATVSFFQCAALRQRYNDELDAALQSLRIQSDEHIWLQQPPGLRDADQPDPVRVDQLIGSAGSVDTFELAAALLLSHAQTDDPRVYLYTLSAGIEVFADRHALLAGLRGRYANGDDAALFEYQKIDGDPFHAQMLTIVDSQVQHINQMSAHLRELPTLLDACTAALVRQLRETLPHLPLDPRVHLLQVVTSTGNDGPLTLITQTLAQAAFDDQRKVGLAPGFERRFLDTRGFPASRADAALFSSAIRDAVRGTAAEFDDLLKGYWQARWNGANTRRDLAIDSFNGSLRREIYSRHGDPAFDTRVLRDLSNRLASEALSGSASADSRAACHAIRVQIDGGPWCSLAGLFVIRSETQQDPAVMLFSSDHRFARFADMPALAAFFETVQGRAQLRAAMALEDQGRLLLAGAMQLEISAIAGPLVADRIDSIIRLQARNLGYAMGLGCTPDGMPAMMDDALDVRQLLDPRQMQLTLGRWRKPTLSTFSEVWVKPAPLQAQAIESPRALDEHSALESVATSAPVDQTAMSWVEQIRLFDDRSRRLREQGNVLTDYAQHVLQGYLSVLLSDTVATEEVSVQWLESVPPGVATQSVQALPVSESQQLFSLDLVSLLLERVSGRRPALFASTRMTLRGPEGTCQIPGALVNQMLEGAAARFVEQYAQTFARSRGGLQRIGDSHLQPFEEALSLREDAMRLDMALRSRRDWIDKASINMIRQVLDRPERSWRQALGEPLTEASSLSLVYGDEQSALMCDTLVLIQPSRRGGAGVLWCGEFGWRMFASVERLQSLLQRKLRSLSRERWIGLLQVSDQALIRDYLDRSPDAQVHIRLDRIAGHAVREVQRHVAERTGRDLRQLMSQAIRCRFQAGLIVQRAGAVEIDGLMGSMLDGLSVRIHNALFEALMPPWLSAASTTDLNFYYDLLARYYLVSDGGRDFLFDIAPLHTYAQQRLKAQLQLDFPGSALDPDQITLTSRHYVTAFPSPGGLPSAIPAATLARSESLTEYAINRFVNYQGANVTVDAVEQPRNVPGLTPPYLRQLARTLNVGAGYVTLLRQALTPSDAHYSERNQLFVDQSVPLLLAVACSEKLKGNLSVQGYNFVSNVLEMPDGIAREPVGRFAIVISPLLLVADEGMTPDPVAGAYVLCPTTPHTGPVVLCVLHYSDFTFREYASLEALMSDIRADHALQALLLDRLEPEVRRRYANGGFTEPHLPFSVEGFADVPFGTPGPVTLSVSEYKGNALQLMFKDTVRLLIDSGVSNAVTNEQDDHASNVFLGTLGLEQVLGLMPGKLAAMIMLWQTQTLFRASAASVSNRHWGEALSEFSAALGVMVSARKQAVVEQLSEHQGGVGSSVTDDERDAESLIFSWGSPSLTADQRVRLQALEAKGVALEAMQHDPLLNVYRSSVDQNHYAVVAGKVYPVMYIEREVAWVIRGADGTRGPLLTLDGEQHWQLDVSLRLRGGGGLSSRHKLDQIERNANDAIIIEASGMPRIRKVYRDRARRIAQAHAQAKRYIENAVDNLSLQLRPTGLDARVTAIVSEFFGVSVPDRALLAHTEETIRSLFTAITDPSLSPFSSPRFVVGANRPGNDSINAFIVPRDPQRRVFLTEQFFNTSRYPLNSQASAEGFEANGHYRAAILIHELSHQALDTYDITYLESMAPYPDLMLADTEADLKLKAHVERLHDFRLSPRAERKNLFQIHDEGQWRDIEPEDDRGYDAILSISEAQTLDEARDVFLTDPVKRARIMMSNADSVTLLALRLGRRNFVLPTP